MRALRPLFRQVFGNAAIATHWFNQVLRTAFVSTITNRYTDFSTIGSDALDMVAQRNNRTLADDDRSAILSAMRRLPAHADVRDGLEQLKAAGYRLAALTNNPQRILDAQLANAGLVGYFEQRLSVDPVRKFKPALETYQYAAGRLDAPVETIWFVAAHDWDISGAVNAGMRGAFLARPGAVMGRVTMQAEVSGSDLPHLVAQIVAADS